MTSSIVKAICSSAIILAISGCGSVLPKRGEHHDEHKASFLSSAKESFGWIVKNENSTSPVPWDWATAIPVDVTRAKKVALNVPVDAVAHFAPSVELNHFRMVSTHGASSNLPLTAVADQELEDLTTFHQIVEQYQDGTGQEEIQIEFSGNGRIQAAEVTPETLLAIEHSLIPDKAVIGITENANPWVLLKEGGVRCKLMARVEREKGLVHVVTSSRVCWGTPVALPVSVQVSCNSRPLPCLNAAGVLEELYGVLEEASDVGSTAHEFATVSELEDYLIPTNYNRLQQLSNERYRHSIVQQTPALISVPGATYPGPAILGDARALSAFLLQQTVCKPGGEEQIGWVLFDAPNLQDGGELTITIDLGQGPRSVTMSVPPK